MKTANDAGTILLTSLVAVAVLAVLSAAYFGVSWEISEGTEQDIRMERALYIAEAGVHAAILDLSQEGSGIVASAFDNGQYQVSVEDLGGGAYQLLASATLEGTTRVIEAVALQGPPTPIPGLSAQSALAIYGETRKKKIKLDIGKDERDFVSISGFDTSGAGADLPAVGMNDPDNYDEIALKLANRFDRGHLDPSQLAGDPTVTINDRHGDPWDTSFVQLRNPTLDAVLLNDIAVKIRTIAQTELVPQADRTLTDARDEHITMSQTWGTPGAPQITVADGKKLKIEGGATVSGNGTLVVFGALEIHRDSTLNWTGDIIIIGNDLDGRGHEAKLKNRHGNLNVTGNIVVVGADRGKAKLDLHSGENDDDADPNEFAASHITGAILAAGGLDDRERSSLRLHHGTIRIDGFVGIVGDRSELKVHKTKHNKTLHLDGGVVVAVPPTLDRTNRADIRLRGHTTITYNSQKVQSALFGLASLAQLSVEENPLPYTFSLNAWRVVR